MTVRPGIPALAVLAVSFTTCDRPADDAPTTDPIVGDWVLTQLDQQAYPMTYADELVGRHGWSMAIAADLAGDLFSYSTYGDDDVAEGYFIRSALTVDAAMAPDYRIEVAGVNLPGGDGGDGSVGDTYADEGAVESDSGDESGTTGEPATARARADDLTVRPSAAHDLPPLVLRCTLVDTSALDCQREPIPDVPNDISVRWRFKRAGDDAFTGL